ncbi:MAG: DUF2029 domain-containing protein [Promethearchaeota archaeon]|nr:MAG: DUF2029 domain-containing protein [Candidatus Lokiarchaeota archaeon]
MEQNRIKLEKILLSDGFKWSVYAFFTILLVLVNLVIIILNFQWDFKIYYFATKYFMNGQSPYNEIYLGLPYVYHPLTLYLFYPFTLCPFYIASFIFLVLKNIAFLFLLYLWIFKFLEKDDNPQFFIFFSLIAFNTAFFIDLMAGNIATFEALFIWFAIFFFLKGRKYYLFVLCIIFISYFKLTPILILFLLIFSKDSKRFIYLIIGFTIFFLFFLIPAFYNPLLFGDYLHYIQTVTREIGPKNPSTLSLISFLLMPLVNNYIISLELSVISSFTLSIISFLLILTIIIHWKINIWKFQKHYYSPQKQRKIIISLFFLVYCLVVPRFKDYSYIIMIFPAFYLIRTINSDKQKVPEKLRNNFLLFLFLFSSYKFISIFFLFALEYNVLISIYLLFLFFLYNSYKNFSSVSKIDNLNKLKILL